MLTNCKHYKVTVSSANWYFSNGTSHYKPDIIDILVIENPVTEEDIAINEDALVPSYDQTNDAVLEALELITHVEEIILDPVYTGTTITVFLCIIREIKLGENYYLFIPLANSVFLDMKTI